uniref:cytochrome c biogenesis protein n=1 Tax=Glaucosphaera vacuolata TaxID=38265 RepID=UPI001FCE1547|nr:cytochrome c biogenesis protein [Glaucosphaera vacuolata]UNJ18647.1 cytochrome c biogenesis protein [Glaucosphaera vacuolata]
MINWLVIENSLINLSFLLSIISTLFYWLDIAFFSKQIFFRMGYYSVLLSCFTISSSLGLRWILNHYFPLSNLYESLLFLSWALIILHLILERKINSNLLGGIITPIVMMIIAFSSFFLPKDMQSASPLVPALKSNWLMMHVSVMIISYAALMIGSLLSIIFLIIGYGKEVSIKGNSTGIYANLDSLKSKLEDDLKKRHSKQLNLLESLDNLSYRTISIGFPLLTVGIIAGAVWANQAWGAYWSWDPKETWALITWIVFASYLHTRINKSWQGKKPAMLASLGFIIIWICYLGVNFIGKGLHSYGWIAS